MPAMVDHTKPEGAQAAADIGAYLASLITEEKPLAALISLLLKKVESISTNSVVSPATQSQTLMSRISKMAAFHSIMLRLNLREDL